MSEMNSSDSAQGTPVAPPTPPAPPVAPPAPVAQTPAPVAQTPAPAPQDPQPAQFAAPVVHSMAVPSQPAVTAPVASSYGTQGMPYAGVPGQVTPPFQAPSATKSFFSRLFDLSFSQYHTKAFAKITYILSLVLVWVVWVFSLIDRIVTLATGYDIGFGDVIFFFEFFLIGSLLAFVVTLFIRLTLEFCVATINNAEDTRRLRELKEKEGEDE